MFKKAVFAALLLTFSQISTASEASKQKKEEVFKCTIYIKYNIGAKAGGDSHYKKIGNESLAQLEERAKKQLTEAIISRLKSDGYTEKDLGGRNSTEFNCQFTFYVRNQTTESL